MLPFVIYSDFESVIINNVHIPCGYALQVISSISGVKFPLVLYRGISEEDVMYHFFDDIFRIEKFIMELYKRNKDINLSEEEVKKKKSEAVRCYLCEKQLFEDKVADHDHITGEFRGIAHNECNFQIIIMNKTMVKVNELFV